MSLLDGRELQLYGMLQGNDGLFPVIDLSCFSLTSYSTKCSGGQQLARSTVGVGICWVFQALVWIRWSHIKCPFCTTSVLLLSHPHWIGQNGFESQVCYFFMCFLHSLTFLLPGYWFLNDANVGASKWAPSPGLVEFIDSAHQAGKKVVYIGFGSIVVSDPKGMTRTVVDAIIQSGVYAILSKGWSDRLVKTSVEEPESSEPLPKQIYPITSIPHDWLFNRIDAACHHGGAGTTGASLRGPCFYTCACTDFVQRPC